MPVALGIGQLAGLDLGVEALGGQRIRGQRRFGEDVEQQQRRQALARRRAFPHAGAAIAGRDRTGVIATVPCEILARVQAAFGPQPAHDVIGDPAAIEGIGAIARDRLHGLGEGGEGDAVAGARRLALGQQDGARGGIGAQPVDIAAPIGGDLRSDREAFGGERDGGLQQPVDAELAVIVGEAAPCLDCARHRHRMHAVGRDLADAAIQEPLDAGGGGRAAGAVIGDDLVAALGRDQHEAIAADAGHRRLDDAERRGGGDRGVDRVAAGAQDVDGDQGGEGMGGCGRAALRDHRGTPRLIKVAIWMEQRRTPCLG